MVVTMLFEADGDDAGDAPGLGNLFLAQLEGRVLFGVERHSCDLVGIVGGHHLLDEHAVGGDQGIELTPAEGGER